RRSRVSLGSSTSTCEAKSGQLPGWPEGASGAQGTVQPIEGGYYRPILRRVDGVWKTRRCASPTAFLWRSPASKERSMEANYLPAARRPVAQHFPFLWSVPKDLSSRRGTEAAWYK